MYHKKTAMWVQRSPWSISPPLGPVENPEYDPASHTSHNDDNEGKRVIL